MSRYTQRDVRDMIIDGIIFAVENENIQARGARKSNARPSMEQVMHADGYTFPSESIKDTKIVDNTIKILALDGSEWTLTLTRDRK